MIDVKWHYTGWIFGTTVLVILVCCAGSKKWKHHPNADTKANPDTGIPYHLETPSQTIVLSTPLLHEISGLSACPDSNLLLAIADETGEVYWIDAHNGEIKKQLMFRDRGDFEGIEQVGNSIFVLKSDGSLFELGMAGDSTPKINIYHTPLNKANDMEGLGYDPLRHSLLLTCKQDPKSDTTRCIMGFDLETKQLSENPVYTIDATLVDSLLPKHYNDKAHFISPAGIAIHPISSEVYVLSSAKKCLVTLDRQSGKIIRYSYLNKEILPQPEGISFDAKGNMFISSEGKNGNAQLLRFDYKPRQ